MREMAHRTAGPARFLLPLVRALVWFPAGAAHAQRVPTACWRSASLLALPTPILAVALPFAVFAAAAYVESATR
jgi:hypothetical protein